MCAFVSVFYFILILCFFGFFSNLIFFPQIIVILYKFLLLIFLFVFFGHMMTGVDKIMRKYACIN